MIRMATEQDMVQLKQLWDASFHDPMSYLDFIYSKAAEPSDTLVYDNGSRILSMMTLIPVNFVYGSQAVRTMYIYGAATDPGHRKKGLMTRMLSYAEDHARLLGCHLCVLVPGEDYLFDYYGSRGYAADFKCRVVTVKIGMIPDEIQTDQEASIDTISAEDVYRIRAEGLKDIPHIEWAREQMEFVLEDSRMYGEHVAFYKGALGEAYALYGLQEKRRLYIKECFGDSLRARYAVLREVIEKSHLRAARIQLPVRTNLFAHEGSVVRYGMAKPLNITKKISNMDPYMNLMLE